MSALPTLPGGTAGVPIAPPQSGSASSGAAKTADGAADTGPPASFAGVLASVVDSPGDPATGSAGASKRGKSMTRGTGGTDPGQTGAQDADLDAATATATPASLLDIAALAQSAAMAGAVLPPPSSPAPSTSSEITAPPDTNSTAPTGTVTSAQPARSGARAASDGGRPAPAITASDLQPSGSVRQTSGTDGTAAQRLTGAETPDAAAPVDAPGSTGSSGAAGQTASAGASALKNEGAGGTPARAGATGSAGLPSSATRTGGPAISGPTATAGDAAAPSTLAPRGAGLAAGTTAPSAAQAVTPKAGQIAAASPVGSRTPAVAQGQGVAAMTRGGSDASATAAVNDAAGASEAKPKTPGQAHADPQATTPTPSLDPVNSILAVVGTPAQQVAGALGSLVADTRPARPAGQSAAAQAATTTGVEPGGTVKTLTVQLNPDHLGPVSITLRLQADAVEIRIAVSTPQALHQLDQDKHVLSAAVAALGDATLGSAGLDGPSVSLHLDGAASGSSPQPSGFERPSGFSSDTASTGRHAQGQARQGSGAQNEDDDLPAASAMAALVPDGSLYV